MVLGYSSVTAIGTLPLILVLGSSLFFGDFGSAVTATQVRSG